MPAAAPTVRQRVAVALAAALAAALVAWVKYRQAGPPMDFAFFWVAARAVMAGADPYAVIQRGAQFDNAFVYPLPAAVTVVPFALMPQAVAGIVFAALGIGCLAYAITSDWNRWPILMSFPALWAVGAGQWSPFVTAAALVPGFAFAAACKPTLGAAMWLRKPSWRFVWVGLIPVVLSLIVMPDWPVRWLDATRHATEGNYHVPLVQPFGFLLLLAAIRWRSPDARLLLGMAIVPQTMLFYDQLPLLLLARTRTQAYLFALWSYALPVVARFVGNGPTADSKTATLHYLAHVITWGMYLPALAWVLWRRDEGSLYSTQ